MTVLERSFRGISLRLAVEYLRGLGGRITEPAEIDPEDPVGPEELSEPVVVEDDHWRARLAADTVEIGPSLSLTEVTVAFEEKPAGAADAEAASGETDLQELVERFSQKAVRAGG